MSAVLLFLAGLVLCNAVPHLAAGLRGEPFPTPFAKPPGRGPSPPLINAVWGVLNLALALHLGRAGLHLPFAWEPWTVLAGFAAGAVALSLIFGGRRRAGTF